MIIRFTGQVDTRYIQRITFREGGGASIALSALEIDDLQIDQAIYDAIRARYGDTITGAELRALLLKPLDRNPDSSLQSDTLPSAS